MVQQHVVQLQVTVDNSLFMQEVQRNADFSRIKSEEKCSEIMDMSVQIIQLYLVGLVEPEAETASTKVKAHLSTSVCVCE